ARIMYVWGPPGSGKTHLLNASCIENRRSGRSSYYLSLEEGPDSGIGCLTDHDSLVCIDNLECIDLDGDMQEALFHTYEMLHAGQGRMLVSANRPLAEIGLTLRDIDSRLSSGGVFQIHPLSDEEKKDALRRRAKDKGFALDDAVINYILAHHSRQPRDLFGLLDRLGSESLRHQRKITVPFMKDLLRE
ncbi:MAG: DnaA regulatory inactivator Hda, partial [Gammaproteobacteria bacterium]|nr:DnaA regulatory inactivator Hda [Gammaproteobacteria bacterium]